MNEHKKNFHIMEELLTIRKDLVQKYFVKEYLSYCDYLLLHQEFNTTQQFINTEVLPILNSLQGYCNTKPDFECHFSSAQIDLITNIVNEVRLFSTDVSEIEIRTLFACCPRHPLKSTCNRKVAFFFDSLCKYKLISARWQRVIDKNGLILSSAKNTPLNSSKLSTALNEAKQNGGCIYRTIEQKVLEIIKKGEYNQ